VFFYSRSKSRPYHLGPYPLETLARDAAIIQIEADRPPVGAQARALPVGDLGKAIGRYRSIFSGFSEGDEVAVKAPLPDDLARRAVDIKGGAYFMNAAQVGICRMPANGWLQDVSAPAHDIAVVIVVENCRVPEAGNLAREWIEPCRTEMSDLRAAEIAICIAGHIRQMGFAARAHMAGDSLVDQQRLCVLAGLAVRDGSAITNPYLGDDFVVSVVTTSYQLETDLPLSATTKDGRGLAYWWGINGAKSGRERRRKAKRATHLSQYPMETVRRVDRPTTLIIDDEVPRVPKRAAFFQRAVHGDLGEKSRVERSRFAFKTPFSQALLGAIRAMVPFQDGALGETDPAHFGDPSANSQAIKSLSYALGSDLTGICEIPRYAWFSHKEDGNELEPYHRYAVVMLVDQEFDTMEAASGDDWVSGAQSMRAYLRGAEIAGVMAEFLRSRGISSRPQTNADSDVLQIPLVLLAGLGELSRIGELVLNPFVGPRFKSVVLTTDLPLEVDKPIDFGLQYFCSNCMKCARECPCDAIPFGDKIMFNGYEMWKPDVERCARYRLTNPKGAACGRCMKTCPINKVVDADGALMTRMASWLGVNALWLKPLMVPIATRMDDWLGNGMRNPIKKWWFDHEVIDGITVDPPKGTNQRDIDPSRKVDAAKQKMAYYHADAMPAPDEQGPVKLNRKAAMASAKVIETPDQARARVAAGGAKPKHYEPTPVAGGDQEQAEVDSPYR
jgi:reductive dehalogenase